MLSVVAFGLLYMVFTAVAPQVSRSYRLWALVCFGLFLAANAWNMLRNEKNRREYLKVESMSTGTTPPANSR
jgi:hypothetical protein